MRSFVEELAAKNATANHTDGDFQGHPLDWDALEASVADSESLERAIGRAVVIADQMSRGQFTVKRDDLRDDTDVAPVSDEPGTQADALLPSNSSEPFFAFNVMDVTPDFGDASRYRTRVVKRMARMFGPNGE